MNCMELKFSEKNIINSWNKLTLTLFIFVTISTISIQLSMINEYFFQDLLVIDSESNATELLENIDEMFYQ